MSVLSLPWSGGVAAVAVDVGNNTRLHHCSLPSTSYHGCDVQNNSVRRYPSNCSTFTSEKTFPWLMVTFDLELGRGKGGLSCRVFLWVFSVWEVGRIPASHVSVLISYLISNSVSATFGEDPIRRSSCVTRSLLPQTVPQWPLPL